MPSLAFDVRFLEVSARQIVLRGQELEQKAPGAGE